MNEIYINKIPTVVKTIYKGVYKKELTKEESYVAEDTYSFQIIETNFGKIALKWIEPYPFEDINEIESKIIIEYER